MNEISSNPSYDVVVIGAGAAGLFAAANAAEAGARTLLIEKMKRPGIKILASGGSKCNVTSTLPIKQLGSWFGVKGERFLRYGLHEYGPKDIREFLHQEGVGTEELPFEKVFPSGGRASDVLRAFLRRLERSGSELRLETPCRGIEKQGDTFVVQTDAEAISCRRVIITSGGASYPKTGCTGDGYAWVKKLGHTVKRPRPALVPLEVQSPWVRALTGIAVPGASVSVRDAKNREAFRRDRPVLFTHRGLSGPGPMDASRYLNEDPEHFRPLIVDWIPHLTREKLAERFRELPGGEPIANRIPDILPRRLARGLVQSARIPNDRRAAELRKDERERLLDALKANPIPVTGDEGFPKAEVTAGGVLLSEVDSRTMASRIVPGLYLAGEILDLDGPIGGFNFQSAFSTGTVAGRAAGVSD